MDVTKTDLRILSNDKEDEVSSTRSDSLPASSLSNNDIETRADGGFALSSAIQEEISFPVALRPNAGHGLLILDVSTSHTTTHYIR